MGSAGQAIKMAIIDHRDLPRDFEAITEDNQFECGYSNSWQQFLERQNPKKLSYLIIRELKQRQQQKLPQDIKQKMRESSVVSKTYKNYYELDRILNNIPSSNRQLIRSYLIPYIRKYQLQKLVVYMFVDDVYEFKLAEYEEPYIYLVANDIQQIKKSIIKRPQGDDSLNFKFRRMVKDLFRRTVVRIFTENDDKQQKKEWQKYLGPKITHSISKYSQDKFRSNLISNYYDFIVVSNSQTFRAIEDFKKTYKFQSQIIYHGDINNYANNEPSQHKIRNVEEALWMHHTDIKPIAKAIVNCTDILAEETTLKAKNVVIFTKLSYGREMDQFIKNHLMEELCKEPAKRESKEMTKAHYQQMTFTVVTTMRQAAQQFNKYTFSYLVTFDCDIEAIQGVKAMLRQFNYDKRAYMYNADEEEGKAEEVQQKLHDKTYVQAYLKARLKKVIEKCAFKIKFQIGPMDEITVYKDRSGQISKQTTRMGLMTTIIQDHSHFKEHYLAKNRILMVSGNTIIMKAKDYINQYKQILLEEQKQLRELDDPQNYLQKVKIIIFDKKEELKKHWRQLSQDIEGQKIDFVHFTFSKIRSFLEIVVTNRINLTTFIKKSLPNFITVQQKIALHKFVPIDMVASITSSSKHLKEVFDNENFELNKKFPISFFKLPNSNKNFEESISFMHDEFIYRYSILWRTGYDVIDYKLPEVCLELLKNDIKQCLYRCKAYLLIDVSEEQFDNFYIKRVQECYSFIDLQITVIYIYSLPHGLSNAIQLIFASPLSTRLTPKIFVGFMVTLFFAFCSFEDEVMKKKKLIVFVDDPKAIQNTAKSIIYSLKIGDVMFNRGFLFSGKFKQNTNNDLHNCLILQFQDIPMLSETRVKNYLNIERFSFYKQNTEYLIAPFTEFTVRNITLTKCGKRHITLSATTNRKKGFVYRVLSANGIDEDEMFEVFKEEVGCMNQTLAQDEDKIRGVKSYYKKAEMIGLHEQKEEMMKSMKEGFEYEYFLKELNRKKYMSALSSIKKKERAQKVTTEVQTSYFNKMLGVQKSLLYYNICEYDIALKELDKVKRFLIEENVEAQNNWTIKKIEHYSHCVKDLSVKRQKYLHRLEKTKAWTVQATVLQEDNAQEQVAMIEDQMCWTVGYQQDLQEFYIEQEDKAQGKLYYYNHLAAFGDLPTAFPQNSTFHTGGQRLIVDLERNIQKEIDSPTKEPYLRKKSSNQSPLKDSLVKQNKAKILPTQSFLEDSKIDSERLVMDPIARIIEQNSSKTIQSDIIDDKVKPQDKININLPQINEVRANDQSSARKPETTPQIKPEVKTQNGWFKTSNQAQSSNITSQSHIQNTIITEQQRMMGVTHAEEWQAFCFNDKYILTQKKHYKKKIANLHHF